MEFITYCLHDFFQEPIQNFSERVAKALAISEATNFTDTDKERIKYIWENTCEQYCIPLPKLDMYVDNEKGIDTTKFQHKIKIISKLRNSEGDFREIKLSKFQIQVLLFNAVMEVMKIVYKHFEKYNTQFDFSDLTKTTTSTSEIKFKKQ